MTSSESPKRKLFRQFATVAKAVAHEHRLELIEAVAQGARSVETLARRTGLSVANASHHLQQMRHAGIVDVRRDGKFAYYSLADDAVLDLIRALTNIGERNLAEVREVVRDYFDDRDSLVPVSRGELSRKIEEDLVMVLDVRPEDEFALGHLPSAVNIPYEDLQEKLAQLPRSKEIVAYCRGTYCVLSFEAVAELRQRGFNVRRLVEGFPEWKAAGLPVEIEG